MSKPRKSVTEYVAALKKAVNAPIPNTKAGEKRWDSRLENAMFRLACRLMDSE